MQADTHHEREMSEMGGMSAQSETEQVTCGCGKTWLAPNARVGTLAGGGAMMKTFCFDCLTLLEVVDGAVTVTPMVPRVDSEAVKATRLWQVLDGSERTEKHFDALVDLGLLTENLAQSRAHVGARFYDDTPDMAAILAALQQSALAPAEWLANELRMRSIQCSIAVDCPDPRPRCSECVNHLPTSQAWIAAALAATGQGQSDGELLDALDSFLKQLPEAGDDLPAITRAAAYLKNEETGKRTFFVTTNREVGAFGDIRDLARALIAQGGADRDV